MKWFKRILKVVLVLVLLLVVGVGVFVAVFDPNDYKPEIQAAVEEQTGRQLVIQDDIGWSVYPSAGVDLGNVTVSNAEGFGDDPQLKINSLSVYVKLLPLLSGDIQVDGIAMDGLVIRISRNKAGRTNYDDVLEKMADNAEADDPAADPATSSDAEDEQDSSASPAISIGRVSITDATVIYDDQQAGTTLELSKLGLALPDGATIDAEAGAYDVPEWEITALDTLRLHGQLTHDDDREQALQGNIQLDEFSPVALLAKLGQPLDMPDGALDSLQLTADLSGNLAGETQQVALNNLVLQLDDTTIKGNLSVIDLAAMALRGDLHIDKLDADQYMGQSAAEATDDSADNAPASNEPTELPTDVLQAINAQFKLTADWLKVADFKMTALQSEVQANNGLVVLKPLQFDSYQGRFTGSARVDARRAEPTFQIESDIKGLAAADLQQDMLQKTYVAGTAAMTGRLETRGGTDLALKQNLNGNINLSFNDGAILGLNLVKYMRQIKSIRESYKSGDSIGEALSAASVSSDEKTDFSLITASCQITQGVARCDDLDGRTPGLRLGGAGKIDLVKEKLDYTATISVVETSQGQGGEDLDELKGVTIPVRCKGQFAEPSCKPDLESIAKEKIKEEIREEFDEKIGDKIEDKIGEDGRRFIEGLFD